MSDLLDVYKTSYEGTRAIGRSWVGLCEDPMMDSACHQLLVVFSVPVTKGDAIESFKIPIPDPLTDKKKETIKLFQYIIENIDKLINYLLEYLYLIHIPRWSKKDHSRFSKGNREIVKVLLLIQKRTQFTLKDILFTHIIPDIIEFLRIPTISISGIFPNKVGRKDLKDAVGVSNELENFTIYSIEYGQKDYSVNIHFRFLKYDDHTEFVKDKDIIKICGIETAFAIKYT